MVRAIVGANWGDEGKGKLTDCLAGDADIVVRFQGGANAGHTVINEYGKFALHILPSGVFRQNVTNIIAQGVAFDPISFFEELETLSAKSVPEPKIMISERAQLMMPYHILFDRLEEKRLGKDSFGSTRSGIAPFYADKCLKTGFQISELYADGLKDKLKRVCEFKSAYAEALYGREATDDEALNYEYVYKYLTVCRDKIKPFIRDTTAFLQNAYSEDKSILLEGQLGTLRDPDNGIYPFATSSSPLAGYGAVGAGLPPYSIKNITAVVKAYSSCVGAGPFVTELFGGAAEELRSRGGDCGEYGAKTGRPRRVGWFDAVASRYGCRLQGATEAALSLLDVLGYLDEIPVCTGYRIDGEITTDFPVTAKLFKAEPVCEMLEGWKCDISGIKTFDALPTQARNYVKFIEDKLRLPVTMISNGPKREDIIYRSTL
ncbi:MAG: adenylosuccinate synthase [Eubacteriales bacterium]|nr:adenylosuccinate synthase [Eubacteriales bacterium]